MQPVNPTQPADPVANPLMVNAEQQAFVVQYFIDFVYNPAEILIWLFQMAQSREETEASE